MLREGQHCFRDLTWASVQSACLLVAENSTSLAPGSIALSDKGLYVLSHWHCAWGSRVGYKRAAVARQTIFLK
jgi:hypothetical protein